MQITLLRRFESHCAFFAHQFALRPFSVAAFAFEVSNSDLSLASFPCISLTKKGKAAKPCPFEVYKTDGYLLTGFPSVSRILMS